MRRGWVLVVVSITALATHASADDRGDPLAQARKAVAESDYIAARPALIVALESGGRGPEDLIEIYRLTGVVNAALGDTKAATAAFTALLALAPKAALPAGTSPKITRPFDAAKRSFAPAGPRAPLELKVETAADPPTITLVRTSDPLRLVVRARVTFAVDGGAERTREEAATDRTTVALPAGRRIDARVAALDVHGNRLYEIGSKEVPLVIIGSAPVVAAPISPPPPPRAQALAPIDPRPRSAGSRPRPIYLRWWPYAAVAVAMGGVAAGFGLSARSDANELDAINADSLRHPRSEAEAVEDRARRKLVITNIGLAGAGAFAIAAGVMFILTPRAETRVAAVPVAGGGAIVVGGKF